MRRTTLAELEDRRAEMARELEELAQFDRKMAGLHRRLEQARKEAADASAFCLVARFAANDAVPPDQWRAPNHLVLSIAADVL